MKFIIPSGDDITIGLYCAVVNELSTIGKAAIILEKSKAEVRQLPHSIPETVVNAFSEEVEKIEPDAELSRFIEVNGTRYGFEPILDNISTGAMADLTALIENGADKNLDSIMAILYRPVTQSWGLGKYRIEPYSDNNGDALYNKDEFHSLSLRHAVTMTAFFLNLLNDLTLSSQMEMVMKQKEAVKEMKELLLSS